jgi:YidC/Oxa1 family membrane protein insertase
MNKRSLWLIAILWAAMALMTYKNIQHKEKTVVVPPAVLLQKAQKAEKAAGNDPKALGTAIRAYQEVANRGKGTEIGAEARLRIGLIQEEKLQQEQRAIQTYKQFLTGYSPDKSAAAKEAETRLNNLKEKLDRQSSTQIGYKTIDALVKLTGANPNYSHALALLIIAFVIKFLTTPLSRKQFKSMREMQKIQPLLKQVQEKYKSNPQEAGRKQMELFKEHGVSPFSSCLPMLIQMPILILLYYKVILAYQFQFVNGKLFWIGSSLAHRFPGIVGADLSQPDIPLLLIYTVSMIVSQKLTIVDPTQAEQQKMMAYMMPIMFAFIFRSFPSALMLYWLFFNIISTTQQYLIMRPQAGPGGPGAEAGGAPGGGGEPPAEPPKRPRTSPGKSRRRRRRFDALVIPRPVLETIS